MSFTTAQDMPVMDRAPVAGPVCQVSLIDRRTGSALRVNGQRLSLLTRQPRLAAEQLMEGRDPARWQIRILTLDPTRRPA